MFRVVFCLCLPLFLQLVNVRSEMLTPPCDQRHHTPVAALGSGSCPRRAIDQTAVAPNAPKDRIKKLTKSYRDKRLCCGKRRGRLPSVCNQKSWPGAKETLGLLPLGGVLGFFGDSIMWQASRAFAIDAAASGFKIIEMRQYSGPLNLSNPEDGQGANGVEGLEQGSWRRESIKFQKQEHEWILDYYAISALGGKGRLMSDLVRHALDRSDLVTLNAGLHYHANPKGRATVDTLRVDLLAAAKELAEFNAGAGAGAAAGGCVDVDAGAGAAAGAGTTAGGCVDVDFGADSDRVGATAAAPTAAAARLKSVSTTSCVCIVPLLLYSFNITATAYGVTLSFKSFMITGSLFRLSSCRCWSLSSGGLRFGVLGFSV